MDFPTEEPIEHAKTSESPGDADQQNYVYPPKSISHEELTLAVTMGRLSQSLSGFSSSSFYLPLLVLFGGAGLSLHGLSFCVPFAVGILVGARLMAVVAPVNQNTLLDLTTEICQTTEPAFDSTFEGNIRRIKDR